MEWTEFKTDKGVSVIYKNIPEFHSVSVGIWIKTGSRFETPQLSGISHYIEHLLFKGTKKRSCNSIKQSVEGVGGTFNGFTSEEATCYWIKILGEYLDLSIDVLADMIQNPLLKDKDLEKERKVILEEISMYLDIPAKHVLEVLDQTIFAGHPLGQSIAGTCETVSKIGKGAVSDYLSRYYTAKNIVVSVSGNISEKRLLKSVEHHLSSIKTSPENSFKIWNRKPCGPVVKIIKKDTEQTHIAMGGLALSRFDEKRYPLAILNTILGGNMSSRLFNRIREQLGLAYAIKSFTRQYQDTGAYVIYAGVSTVNTHKSIKAVVEELRKIIETGVKKSELERAKKFLVSQILMGKEDNLEYMLWLGEQRLFRETLVSTKEVLDKIKRVTQKDLQNIAAEIFKPSNFYAAIIGPEADEEKIINTINTLK